MHMPIHTPPQGFFAAGGLEKQRHVDDKIAQNPLFKYSDSDPASLIIRVSNYLVGVTSEMHPFLAWAFAQQHNKISDEMIRGCRDSDPGMTMTDCISLKLSQSSVCESSTRCTEAPS